MIFRPILTILMTIISLNVMADDGKYDLKYQKQNQWVAQEDLTSLKQAIAFFQNNDLKIQATCQKRDLLCQQRIEIINYIFSKQKVKQHVSKILENKSLQANTISLMSVDLDPNKYSNLFINYENSEVTPIEKSVDDFNNLLKKAELKYLSQFKMYCKKVDTLCKNRFNYLTDIISKNLSFKYNFSLYENANLDNNQAQIVNHRHNYNINNPIEKPKTTAAIEQKKVAAKKASLNYNKDENVIVFHPGNAELLETEKSKIEKLIKKIKDDKFSFICNLDNKPLCQQRIHNIKNYVLKNTNNTIYMYQLDETTTSNYVIIKKLEK